MSNEHKRCLSKENLTWRYIKLITSPNLDANWKLNMTNDPKAWGLSQVCNMWHYHDTVYLSLPKLSRIVQVIKVRSQLPPMTVVSVCGGAAVVDATSIPEGKKHHWRWHKTSMSRWHALNVELQPFTNCSALLKSNHEKLLSIVEE